MDNHINAEKAELQSTYLLRFYNHSSQVTGESGGLKIMPSGVAFTSYSA